MSYVSIDGSAFLQKFPNTSYKFSVENRSLSESFILNDFWNWFTPRFIPEYLAPNLVTSLGFVCLIFVWIIQCLSECVTYWELEGPLQPSFFPFLSPEFAKVVIIIIQFLTRHSYLIMPILLFAYQTLDGCDGKQARRTKNSTPLGEIFDHGVDAIAASIFMFSFVCSLDKYCRPDLLPIGLNEKSTLWTWFSNGMTAPHFYMIFFSFFLQVVFSWAFFSAHVQHYHRGTFYMAELGACDFENLIIGTQLFRYFFGTKLFHLVIFEHRLVGKMDLGYGLLIILFFATLLGAIQSIIDVLVNADKPRRQSLIYQYTPLIFYSILVSLYIFLNPLLVVNHFFILGSTLATPFGVILTTLNIARVTNQNMNAFGFAIFLGAVIPLSILVFNSIFTWIDPYYLLCAICIFCTGFYIHFTSSVIGSFCGALRIQFLLINPVIQKKD